MHINHHSCHCEEAKPGLGLRSNLALVAIAVFIFILPLLVFAKSLRDSEEKIAAGVIGHAGIGASYDVTLKNLFGEDEDELGQNLYDNIYRRTKYQSSDMALNRLMAGRSSFSRSEILNSISGAQIGELLTKKPSEQLSPAKVEERRKEVQAALADEKELADLEVESLMEVESTELFSNGDESDSGFDLIVDLDIIETILFGRQETSFGDSGPGAPAGSPATNVFGGTGGRTPTTPPSPGTLPPGSVPPGRAGGGNAATPPQGAQSGSAGEATAPQESAACPVNPAFNEAVIAAQDREAAQAAADGAGGPTRDSGTGGPRGRSDSGAGAQNGTENQNAPKPPLIPAPPANWARPTECEDIFCLSLDLVYKKESSYAPSDNCIACHFEKMNDALKKTTDHNLVPNKVSGNLFEPAKCKGDLSLSNQLKFTISTIGQPILTPPYDDLVTKGNFLENFFETMDKFYGVPYRCGAAGEAMKKITANDTEDDAIEKLRALGGAGCKAPPDYRAETARNILNQSADNTPQKEFIQQINQSVARNAAQIVTEMEQTRLADEAKTQGEQYSVLMQELDTMNRYFKGFEVLYHKIGSKNESDAPCKLLLNKPTCS